MKRIALIFCLAALTMNAFSQAPQAFNYQAVARDGEGIEIAATKVSLQISILQGSDAGTPVFVETFSPTTNAFGLFSVEIGNGSIVSGDFTTINWGEGPYFIKTEVDPDGGTSYTDLGTAQLMSAPYALMAAEAETAQSAESAETAVTAETAVSAETAISAETAHSTIYADTAYYADTAHHAETASNVFDGDYNKLINTPDWNDTIASRLDSALFLTGEAVDGDLITFDGMNWIAEDIHLASVGSGHPISNIQPYLTVNYCIALIGIFPSRNWEPFIGTIGIFAFNFAPRGWATCEGQLLSIAQNTALFALVGTYYGGDGRTTFGIPDLRGRVPISQGTGPGLSSYSIGSKGGAEEFSISVTNLPSHTHTVIFE